MSNVRPREIDPQPLRQDADRTPERVPFEPPRLERRGTLPKVTTAFGGTFTP